MNKPKFPTEAIIFMYIEKHLTMREIADMIGISKAAVSARLRKANIDIKLGEHVRLVCTYCEKEFTRPRSRVRKNKEKQYNYYCSSSCYYYSIHNSNYIQWRHGQRIAKSIVSRFFTLTSGQIIHHRDGNNGNNSLNNLMVFASQSDHLRWHRGKNKPKPLWDGAKIS